LKVLFAGNGNNLSTYSRHAHTQYEIILTVAGSAHAFYGDTLYIAERGHIALLPPNTPHNLTDGVAYSDLYIRLDTLDFIENEPLILNDDSGLVEPLMRTLYTVWVQKEENCQQICDNLLEVILYCIRKQKTSKNRYDFVDKLKSILALHLSDVKFSIKETSAKLGISTDYLRHCFKSDTGMTPLEYLTSLRIAQARRYLKQDNGYTVSEIAFLCGFSDPYYFSRCFKKQTGLSPKAYRDGCKYT